MWLGEPGGDPRLRWLSALAVAALLALALGCTSEGSVADGNGSADDQRSEDRDDYDEGFGTPTEPPDDPDDTDDPTEFAFGQEARIVEGAVHPALLAADIGAAISIRNTTDSVVEVRFPHPGWDEAVTETTGPLAPGEAFTLDPIGVVSITYEVVGTGITGMIQVEDGVDTL